MYSRVGRCFLGDGGALRGFWQRKLAFLVGRRGEGEGLIPCGTRLLGKKGVDDREDKEGPLPPPRIRKLNYECILKMCFKGRPSIDIELGTKSGGVI